MTNQEAKAEAEKIKEEFYKAIPLKGFKGTYSTFNIHESCYSVRHHSLSKTDRGSRGYG